MGLLAGGAVIVSGIGQVFNTNTNSAKLGGEMTVSDFSVSIGADCAAWWSRCLSCSLSWELIGMVAKLSVSHFYKELNKLSHRSNICTLSTYSSAFLWSSSLNFKKFLKADSVRVVFWNLDLQM